MLLYSYFLSHYIKLGGVLTSSNNNKNNNNNNNNNNHSNNKWNITIKP